MTSKSTVNQRPVLKDPAFPLGVLVSVKFPNWKHPKEGTFTQSNWCGDDDNYSYSFHWGPHNGPFYSQENRQAFPNDHNGQMVDKWVIRNTPEVWLPTGEKWSCFK